MNKETFIVVTHSDGDVNLHYMDSQGLQKRLAENYYGEDIRFVGLDMLLNKSDPNYWGENTVLVIKGAPVVPKAVTQVTHYEF